MYPRANTPGCTKQACGFRDNYSELKKLGFEVFGLSYDKPKSQTNWINKYELQYKCITDTDGAVIKAFGASKAAKSILRSHVVVAKGGDIIDIQNGISPGDSFTTALETAKEAAKKS
jgi:thioredoxin-dependent peroxiredoxin